MEGEYMLEKIKPSLRIKSSAFDSEINDLIESAKLDLQISGIDKTKITNSDPLILQAIKLYCKANFGLDNKESDKYQLSYNLLKQSLALCSDYNTITEGVTI